MNHSKFVDGDFDTNFLHRYFKPEDIARTPDQILKVGAIAAILQNEMLPVSSMPLKNEDIKSRWRGKSIEYMR
jgi:hypothetical protein